MKFKEYKLQDICKVVDSLHKTPSYENKGVPMIRVTDLKDGYFSIPNEVKLVSQEVFSEFSKKHIPEFNDILMSRVGSYGITSIIKTREKFCLGQNTIVITDFSEEVLSEYLFYYLISSYGKELIEKNVSGSTQKTISLKSINNFNILLPEKSYQNEVINILSSFYKKIEVNNKIIANLEEQAQAIFKSWFVDFEPFQDGNFVESELGMIPEGWKVREISDLVTYNKRGFSPKYIENRTGIPVINQRCIRDNKIIEEAVQYHDINKKKVPKDKYYEPFDVLINSMGVGTLGRVSQVSKLSERRIVHSCITILRAKNSIIKPSIFGQMMIYNQKLFESMGQGTTGQTSLKNKEIDKLKFVIAPINIQNNIDGFFNYFLEFRDSLLDENKRLAEIRDALLPRLMSGEIDVSNIKIKGEEVKNE